MEGLEVEGRGRIFAKSDGGLREVGEILRLRS